jgi:hypothetical protein
VASFLEELDPPESFDDGFERRTAAADADMKIRDMFLSWDMKLQPEEYTQEVGSGGGVGREHAREDAVQMWQDAYGRMFAGTKG